MNLESGYLTAMRAEYQRLTGALPGEDSDIGIRMALLANQLELLEEELGALRQAADPETAEGEMLDRHADSRGLRRKEAAAAGGVLRFYREGAAAQEIDLPERQGNPVTVGQHRNRKGKTGADVGTALGRWLPGGCSPAGKVLAGRAGGVPRR